MTTVRESPGPGLPSVPRYLKPTAEDPQRSVGETGGFSYAWRAYPSLRLAVAVLSLAIAALVIWLVFLRSTEESTAQPGGGPVASTQADLAALSMRLAQPIYWAGPRPGSDLETTVTANEYVYVRYLTSGAEVGDDSPRFLTVATYPAVDALENLRAYARHGKATITHIPGGGIAVPVPGSPTSVYFASRHSDYQIEVFDPNQGEALDLIKSRTIVPVPGGVEASGAHRG